MKKQVGETFPKTRADQKVAGLDFDGMAGDGVNRSGDRFAGNHFGEHMKENFGSGPRRGNQSDSASHGGPSVTRDKHKLTIATASQGGRINGGASREFPSNPDKIYIK